MIDEDQRARLVQVVGRAEADGAALVLRQAIHPAARGAVERHLVAVASEEVLPEILAELLEEIAQPPDDRIVAQHAVLLLRDVADEDEHQQRGDHQRGQRAEPVRQDVLDHAPPPGESEPKASGYEPKLQAMILRGATLLSRPTGITRAGV